MGTKGVQWLRNRILTDGSIDSSGNTRTGASQETTRSGKVKELTYYTTVKALYYWSQVLNDPEIESDAIKISRYRENNNFK